MSALVALLAGINVGGHRKVPMADLRALAEGLGFKGARTYIQSGNLVVDARCTPASVEAKLEAGLLSRFGFQVPVLVRTGDAWTKLLAENPFRDVDADQASRVFVLLSKASPSKDAVPLLLERAVGGERLVATPSAVWAHYPEGMGTTKLTPVLIDRLVGSKVTARNLRTVNEVAEMLAAT